MVWRSVLVVMGTVSMLPVGSALWAQIGSPSTATKGSTAVKGPMSTIAFGSCCDQDRPQPIWEAVIATDPQLFLFIGDTIYGDSTDPEVKRRNFRKLAAKPGYQKLKATCPILATWDDHDYGTNDIGGEHPNKRQMQKVFLDFFDEPADSPVRRQEGIYQAAIYGPPGKRVQVILFDSRYHRGPLKGVDVGRGYRGYLPGDDPTVPLLGEAQWQWFEEQIEKPAEVRLIVSSIQILPDNHPLEKWSNLPHERERLFATIRDAKLAGVVFLSGDQHLGELSKLQDVLGYDAYELTSSGMTHTREDVPAPNRYRVGRSTRENNFGLVEIDWDKADPVIQLSVRNESGEVQLQQELKLSQLQPAGEKTGVEPAP